MRIKWYIGLSLIFAGIGVYFYTIYQNTAPNRATLAYSSYSLVQGSWERYKADFITSDGRVLDSNITTSEGQSYALLRAVWMDDQPTFDNVWSWTQANLQKRPDDKLFYWRWTATPEGRGGVANISDQNSASDATVDIALALIFASERFNDQAYANSAREILYSLWDYETGTDLQGNRYLVAGNWARGQQQLVLNPSYFSPYAFRIFAKFDTDHDWMSLVDSSYTVLEALRRQDLLPPDWVGLNRETSSLEQPSDSILKTNYSYDALRVPMRIGLDVAMFPTERGQNYLRDITSTLAQSYQEHAVLFDSYSPQAAPLTNIESPAMYATYLIGAQALNETDFDKLYQTKIIRLYSNDSRAFRQDIPYYEQNLLWFAAAFKEGYLVNLADQLPEPTPTPIPDASASSLPDSLEATP
jgi:endo-1,4-beta-D-glucanase Y